MAFIAQSINEYTYQVSYKETSLSEEILITEETRIIPATTTVLQNGNVVTVPNPNYNYFMNSILSYVTPIKGATLIIRRNKVYEVDPTTGARNEIADVKEVYREAFDFLDYNYRVSIVLSDVSVGAQNFTVLVQILNVNEYEKITSNYVISGLCFATEVSEPQHVDISWKLAEDTDFTDLELDYEVPTTGELPALDLGKLPDDIAYVIRIYHHELDEVKFFSFTSNLNPTIGPNPIIGKVEWNGRQIALEAPNLRAGMFPARQDAEWMFPMDYSTKSFDNIVSSLWASNADAYLFTMKSTLDFEDEVYVGVKVDSTHYYGLPTDYVNPQLPDNGASQNIFFETLFHTSVDPAERRTLFCKFYIDEFHTGDVRLFSFDNSTGQNTFIGFNTTDPNNIKFSAFGQSFDFPTGEKLRKGKWYTLMLVIKNTTILFASITDYSNYSFVTLPINSGAMIGNLDSKANLLAADRANVPIEITYNASTVDSVNMGIAIEFATYQYQDNTPENNLIDKGKSPAKLVTSGNSQTISFTAPNVSGYGITVGWSLRFLNGGVTSNGSVTITDFKVKGVSIMSLLATKTVTINEECVDFIGGTPTTINFIKSADTISDPIGGVVFENITATGTYAVKTPILLGGKYIASSNYLIAKVGLVKSVVTEDSWLKPYNYFKPEIMEMLGGSYKLMPVLTCDNVDGTTTIIPTTEMSEMKDSTVRFYLSNLPVGYTNIKVTSGSNTLSTRLLEIKSVKMGIEQARYDINFEEEFDSSIREFTKRYYAKQKRWGGNMGGGTNGNLIYFNRGEKCLILEQHGDKYKGIISSVAPAGREGYGLPVDIVETPSTSDNQINQRTTRVGGLIQSIDYHAYGMFDCWFSVPKGMGGLAICLWYFHYQEIYNYDKEFEFWTKIGWNGFKYEDSVESGFGATWVVINNEIDMELGSENTPYRVSVNPNNDQSISWFVPGLDRRQMIGCTNPNPDLYGTWLIDWEASLPEINMVTETDPQNAASYIWTSQLTWVKVNNKLDEVNYGANNRSCRFNNWVNERWNDGTGVYGVPQNSPLGKGEMSVNNRIPLGEINPKALEQHLRYVEKYYDDGKYHKWSIDWTKDYTRLLIDDEEIAVLKAFVPFNPMTMLIGCWFPSGNVYDKGVLLGEWGTWGGVHANWSYAQMKVKRIKFEPYTEEEASTEELRYDCETYAEDGLREILLLVNISINTTPEFATVTINGVSKSGSNPKIFSLIKGEGYFVQAEAEGYWAVVDDLFADKDKSFDLILPLLT